MVMPDLDALSLRSLKADDMGDSRTFYKWLEGQWPEERLEETPPTRFLLDELDNRGSRIQAINVELEQLRERLLEREVQIVRLESEAGERQRMLADMGRDLEALGERYRKALQSASESRRAARDVEHEVERLREQDAHHAEAVARLHSQMEELMAHVVEIEHAVPTPPTVDAAQHQSNTALEARLLEAESQRRIEGDRYRELFGEKDAMVHSLQRELKEKEAEVARLHGELASWPMRGARSLGRILGR